MNHCQGNELDSWIKISWRHNDLSKKKYQGWKLHVVYLEERDKMSILRGKEISLVRLGNPPLLLRRYTDAKKSVPSILSIDLNYYSNQTFFCIKTSS